MPSQLNKSLLLALLALLLFSPMFVIQRTGPVDFWWWMSINLVVLTSLSLISDRFFRADICGTYWSPNGNKYISFFSYFFWFRAPLLWSGIEFTEFCFALKER